jgi:hypothetical protein
MLKARNGSSPCSLHVFGQALSRLLASEVIRDCDPSPMAMCIPVEVGGLFIIATSWLHGISRNASRARWALRMSLASKPGLAWLTLASTSPVTEWTT